MPVKKSTAKTTASAKAKAKPAAKSAAAAKAKPVAAKPAAAKKARPAAKGAAKPTAKTTAAAAKTTPQNDKKPKPAKTAAPTKAAAKPPRTPAPAKKKAGSQQDKTPVQKKTKAQIKVYRQRLLELRYQLVDEVKVLSDNSLVSNKQAGEELADIGSDNFMRDMELSLMDEESKKILLIQDALERLDNGTYGICLDCDKEIREGRLEALPYAKLCVSCKSRREENEAAGIVEEEYEEIEITE